LDLVLRLLMGVGIAIPAGISPFMPLLVVSVAGVGGAIKLNEPFGFIGTWAGVIAFALVIGIDVFAAKIPQISKGYNAVNYVLRPLAGGVLFAAVVPSDTLPIFVSFVLGAILAGVMFVVLVRLRPAITANSKYAVIYDPLFSIGLDMVAAALSVLGILVPIVGGPLSILVLALSILWLVALRAGRAVTPPVPTNQP
jgi:Domain of unknown function (DUF4126)